MSADEKAVEEAAITARHYLDQILLDPLSEFGLLLRDKVSFWRFKNQVNMVEKARLFLEKKGIDATSIASKVLPENVVPLIEAGCETSDPMLSDMFAGLLASAVNPDTASTSHPSFGKVLNQFAPLDAVIVLKLHKSLEQRQRELAGGNPPDGFKENIPLHRQLGFQAVKLAPALGRTEEEINLSFQNIRRLGICDYGHDFLSLANQVPRISFTDFGMSFMKACTQSLPSG